MGNIGSGINGTSRVIFSLTSGLIKVSVNTSSALVEHQSLWPLVRPLGPTPLLDDMVMSKQRDAKVWTMLEVKCVTHINTNADRHTHKQASKQAGR